MKKKRLSPEARKYWCAFGVKILENLASVKVWFFILPFIVSTAILSVIVGWHLDFIRLSLNLIVEDKSQLVPILSQMKIISDVFIGWCTFNVSLVGTIVVVREIFKVKKLIALNEEKSDNSEKIKEMNA